MKKCWPARQPSVGRPDDFAGIAVFVAAPASNLSPGWQSLLTADIRYRLKDKIILTDEVRVPVLRIDHILIAMPPGREDEARAFYHGILGLAEKVKPPQLAARGGCWFESGSFQVHLGVEKNFIPARKAHPAFIVEDLAGMVTKAKRAGYQVTADEPIEGYDRRHVDDPFGNRIELIEPHAK